MGSAGYCVECTDHCAGAHFRSLNRRCATRAAHLSAPPLLPLCHAWHTSRRVPPCMSGTELPRPAPPCSAVCDYRRPWDLQAVQDQLLETNAKTCAPCPSKCKVCGNVLGKPYCTKCAPAHGDEREVRQAHLAALPPPAPVGCREAGVDQRVGHQQRRKMREGERQWV